MKKTNGITYWGKLNPKSTFSFGNRIGKNKKLCHLHFEVYHHSCPRCSKHFIQSVYDHMTSIEHNE